jgi:negative regulator of sigma E activity
MTEGAMCSLTVNAGLKVEEWRTPAADIAVVADIVAAAIVAAVVVIGDEWQNSLDKNRPD